MTPIQWLAYVALAALAIAFAFWLYRGREQGGRRGRHVGATLRAGALCLALLLLFDPLLPSAEGPHRVVVLDDSYSMTLPAAPGTEQTRWRRALERVGALDPDAILTTSGRPFSDTLRPDVLQSALSPALRAAAEAGADELWVLTDAAVTDAAAARGLAAGTGLAVRAESMSEAPVANIAVASVEAPGWVTAGDTIEIRVELAGVATSSDSVEVELRSDTGVVARRRIAAPDAGVRAETAFRVATDPQAGGGVVRYEVAHGADDAVDEDDARPVYVELGEQPAGVVLVSFRPDWEPRFLLRVIERAVGLPARGYLRLGTGEFLPLGTPASARPVPEARVREALGGASLVVVHGLTGAAPAWGRALLERERVLVLSSATAGAGVIGEPLAGEWYPVADLTSSPLLPLMATAEWGGLPPLRDVRALSGPANGWTALGAQRDRRGAVRPLLVGWRDGERRRVVAVGAGYYRWALGGDASRQAYRALWSAAAAWLAEDASAVDLAPFRPTRRVFERGQAPSWVAGAAADSVRLTIESEPAPIERGGRGTREGASANMQGEIAADTTLSLDAPAPHETAALPPGRYSYRAQLFGPQDSLRVVEGEFAVAGYTPELVSAMRPLEFDVAGVDDAGRRGARRLHTYAWPWLLLVALLCGEWLLRRRLGLR